MFFRKWPLLFCCILCCVSAKSQHTLPSYPELLKSFFSRYSYETEEPQYQLVFAKRKTGWYADIIDAMKSDSILREEIFWDRETGQYQPLSGFRPALSEKEQEKNMEPYLSGQNGFSLYNYERCPYYGYARWAADVIQDYRGQLTTLPDTALDGLARAYSFYASGFLWNQYGPAVTALPENMRTAVDPMQIPDMTRIILHEKYTDSALMVYRLLAEKSPGYTGTIGNASMKVFNELYHAHMEMQFCREKARADQYLQAIQPDSNLLLIAQNYLCMAAPNAIVFTFGDNDTYPLLYAQEYWHYRTDVSIINYSLLGYLPYVRTLKESGKLQFSLTAAQFGNPKLTYGFYNRYTTNQKKTQLLQDLFQQINLPNKQETGAPHFEYDAPGQVLPVNPVLFKKLSTQTGLGSQIVFQYETYVLLNDLLILDIVRNNIHTRPVYFTSSYEAAEKYQQPEGLLMRLLPLLKNGQWHNPVSAALSEKYLTQLFKPMTLQPDHRNIETGDYFDMAWVNNCLRLAYYFQQAKETAKARAWAVRAVDYFNTHKTVFNESYVVLIDLLRAGGDNERARLLLNRLETTLANQYHSPDALHTWIYPSEYVRIFQLLEDKKATLK